MKNLYKVMTMSMIHNQVPSHDKQYIVAKNIEEVYQKISNMYPNCEIESVFLEFKNVII